METFGAANAIMLACLAESRQKSTKLNCQIVNKMMDIKRLSVTEINVRNIISKLKTCEERTEALQQVAGYLEYICQVQSHKFLVREQYYPAAIEVYNFLRENHQLDRDKVGIDRDVKTAIELILSKLLAEYGSR